MSEARQTALDCYDALLLDLDGTLYRGGTVVPGAVDAVRSAQRHSVAVRFVTNNASRSPGEIAERLQAAGFPAVASEVNTSAQAAATVVAEHLPRGSAVLIVGADALSDEVAAAGMRPVRSADEHPDAVVQGFSPDVGWRALAEASMAIRAGALWVACNTDATLPTERGELPGNGSLVQALRHATGACPMVAGKPARPLLNEAVRAAGARRPLVVGDRLETDIAGAVTSGLPSMLVLSGVSTAAAVLAAGPQCRPDYLAAGPGDLLGPLAGLGARQQPGWDVQCVAGRLRVSGDGEPLSLLRALCAVWWSGEGEEGGPADVVGDGAVTRSVLAKLGL